MDPDEKLKWRERTVEEQQAEAHVSAAAPLTPREQAEAHVSAAARSLQRALMVLRDPAVVDGAAEIRAAASDALVALDEGELDQVREPLERIRDLLDAGPRFAPVEAEDFGGLPAPVMSQRAAVRAALRRYGIDAGSGAVDSAIAAAETGI